MVSIKRLVLFVGLASGLLQAQSPQLQAALAAGSYFPLEVGNRWTYRLDGRAYSGGFQTWRVDRTEERDGKTYSVVAISVGGRTGAETFFRTDDKGRMYILTGQGEQLFLDPVDSSPAAQLGITARGAFRASIGSFSDTLSYREPLNPLLAENGVLARGIGLLQSTQVLLTGSSGGPTDIRTLVEAQIGGKLVFSLPSTSVQLSVEHLNPDLSGRLADNCIVPCYFVACYLAFGTDPPGTYKPCTRARVSLTNLPEGASRSVHVQMLNADSKVVFDRSIGVEAAPGEDAGYFQLLLYSEPNVPLPPGRYRLTATTEDGIAESTLVMQIK